jgi:hypothetical protein
MSAGASSCRQACSRRRWCPRGRCRGPLPMLKAIAQHDADSRRALADARELYASAEARASTVSKQEVDLAVRAC